MPLEPQMMHHTSVGRLVSNNRLERRVAGYSALRRLALRAAPVGRSTPLGGVVGEDQEGRMIEIYQFRFAAMHVAPPHR